MTKNIKKLLDKIEDNPIFRDYPFFFTGGTALSVYLNHRVSHDIDIASTIKLPISAIKTFAFGINGKAIADKNASQFKINTGEDIQNYYLKYMVDGVKLEFSHFQAPIQKNILQNAKSHPYKDNSKLQILGIDDIIKLKTFALFNRQKTRDLFDMAIILERDLITIDEVERIYSFTQAENKTLREYIDEFSSKDDEGAENSLDFLPQHEHYKTFSKLIQNDRFIKAKEMFLQQYENKQISKFDNVQKEARRMK
jgi:predicted nucleotidyltransferase component of viral defense system